MERDTLHRLLRDMLLSRVLEERAAEEYGKGNIVGCVAAADGERSSCTLSCDHRVLAGADAARFLATLADHLAKPGQLTEVES